jgi:transcriptional regulator with XRE-family HTH domain
MAEQYKAQVGARIALRRQELGLTQKDLAERTHYKEAQTVSRWERGETLPSNLDAIADALDWTLDELVAGVEAPNAKVARQLGIKIPIDGRGSTPDLVAQLSATQLDRIEESLDLILGLLEKQVGADVFAAVREERSRARDSAPADNRHRAA